MGRTRPALASVSELKQKISLAKERKRYLEIYLEKLRQSYAKGEISYSFYVETIHLHREGRTIEQWINYYEHRILVYQDLIKKSRRESIKKNLVLLIFSSVFLFLILTTLFYIQPELTGFAVQQPGKIVEIVSDANATLTTTQQTAVLGQPVKWIKKISLSNSSITKVRLPIQATNISVKKITSHSDEINQETLQKEDSSPSLDQDENLDRSREQRDKEEFPDSETGARFTITGNVVLGGEEIQGGFLVRLFRNLGKLTGQAILEPIGLQEIEIDDNSLEYEVEYETPAPYAIEENIEKGKRVKIVSPSAIHYENVLAFTNLDESLNVKDPSQVKIHWVENQSFISPTLVQDTDNNGIYDYIEWIAPSLSTQTFDIIVITKAEHLDSNKNFVSNIYEEVKELDDIWSEPISSKDYVRVTFEIPLTSNRDITLYPRIVSGNPRIEIYEANKKEVIAEFTSLNDNKYNKVFLTNLKGEQDVFDLRVIGGIVEFDHIIDPTLSDDMDVTGCTVADSKIAECFTVSFFNDGDTGTSGATVEKGGIIFLVMDNTTGLTADSTINLVNLSLYHDSNNGVTGLWDIDIESEDGVTNYCSDNTINHVTTPQWDYWDLTSCTTWTKAKLDDLRVQMASGDGQGSTDSFVFELDINVSFFNPAPSFNNPQINETGFILPGMAINHSINISRFPTQYLFSWNASGASCDTWVNSSWTTVSGRYVTASNSSEIPSACVDKTIGWRFYGNNSEGINSSSIQEYTISSFGTLNVDITLPTDNTNVIQNETFFINATITCSGGAGAVCGSVSALARYNGSGATPDTDINVTSGATPLFISGGGSSDTLAYWRPISWNGNLGFINPENASDLDYNDSATKGDIEGSIAIGEINYTFTLFSNIPEATLYYTWNCTVLSDSCSISAYNYTSNSFNTIENRGTTFSTVTNSTELTQDNGLIDSSGNVTLNFLALEGSGVTINLHDLHITTAGNTYDYNGVTNPAGSTTLNATYNESFSGFPSCPGGFCSGGSEFVNDVDTSDTAYQDIWFIENADRNSTTSLGVSFPAWENYHIKINESAQKISSFTFEWRGDYTELENEFNISIWNNTDSNWGKIYEDTASVSDKIFTREISSSIDSYIDSDGYMHFLLYGSDSTFTTIETDYIKVNVQGAAGAQNPITSSETLEQGESFYPNWTVNATGTEGTSYEIDVLFNSTTYPNDITGNDTEDRTVNIVAADAGTAPVIYNVSVLENIVLTDGPNPTYITINFSVNDSDGAADLDNSSAMLNLTRNGEELRLNSSCSPFQFGGNHANYTCNVTMWWYDVDGDWVVHANITDLSSNLATNSTHNRTVDSLTGIVVSPSELSFSSLTVGSTNQTPSDFFTLNNTGNVDISSGNVQINATDLIGETNPGQALWAGNFSGSPSTGGDIECNASTTDATALVNYTFTNIVGSILAAGNFTLEDGTGQENVYLCLREVGSELDEQQYSTNAFGSWTIRILLVAITPARRRKKKSKKLKKSNKILKLLTTLTIELKEEYSREKEKLIKKLMKAVQEEYDIKRREILELVREKELTVPTTIFSKKLGALEALTKYMKENLNMNYKEIAERLGRNERTIWTAYKKAIEKMEGPIKTKKTKMIIPLSIFENKELTVLESLIVYLKEKGMKYSEIAETLERDQRNIWTIYSRVRKKLNT